MTPIRRYRLDLDEGRVLPDAAQEEAITRLDELHRALVAHWQRRPGMAGLLRRFRRPVAPARGLYLWGGVGRGKTYLMDLFHQCLPGERKMRMHFHRFMQMVHRELQEQSGQSDPLVRVARSIADRVDVICFDEFFVSDIGDAMILANLLDALFARGVVLVATSNLEPARLYENGLQRQKFLPAIALLERYTDVLNVDGGVDYRLRNLEKADIYHSPLGSETDARMAALFATLADGAEQECAPVLDILGRAVHARRMAEGLVWFDFRALCEGPRGAADYIEIARLFHTVLLSDIPALGASRDDAARRFISLVDEFYDRGVKLIISAAVPLEELYQGTELAFAFERTRSRLLEMRSHDYLAREHRP